jgi:hypothetical protein
VGIIAPAFLYSKLYHNGALNHTRLSHRFTETDGGQAAAFIFSAERAIVEQVVQPHNLQQ